MSLHGLLDAVVKDTALAEAITAAADGNRMHVDLVGPPAPAPFTVAALARDAGRPVLAVTATGREAEDLAAALRSLLPPEGVVEYPSWETLPHERLSPRSDTVGRRLAVLRRLAHPRPRRPRDRPGLRRRRARALRAPAAGQGVGRPGAGLTADRSERRPERDRRGPRSRGVRARGAGREARRVRRTRRHPGRLPAHRGAPPRVEFWGDDVEEIRYFKVADQRSLEVAEHGLWAPPCRELLLTADVRERARVLAEQHPELGELLGKIAEGIAVEGMESLAPVLVDDMELLLDVLPKGAMTVVCDPERVRTRASDLVATSQEFLQASWAATAGGGEAPIDVGAASLWSIADVRDRARELDMMWWSVSPFAADEELDSDTLKLGMHAPRPTAATPRGRSPTPRAGSPTAGARSTSPRGTARRPAPWRCSAARASPPPLDNDLGELTPSVVHVSCGCIDHGFVDPALKLAVLTETDLTGQKASGREGARMPARRRKTIDPLTLEAGDHVVHEQHGVGRYIEMVQRTVQGATREYLVVEYAPAKRGQPGDRLYIPTDQLEQITKYVGGEAPTLHRLGGADWTKTKARAKKAVKEIAADLIKLYSARMAAPGTPSGPTRRGSASWRTPSRTRRRPTS